MPKSISKKFYVERLRVYASGGESVCDLPASPVWDPENACSMGYSTMRQYAFGINLTF